MGGYLQLEFRRHRRVLDLEFPQGRDKSVFRENAYFMDLISSQIKLKLTTLLATPEAQLPKQDSRQASINQ